MTMKFNIARGIALSGAAVLATGLAACNSGGSGGDGEVTLDIAHVGDLESPQQSVAELFEEKLAETDAGIELNIHDSGTLGNETELQGAVTDCSLDIAIAGSFSHYAPWAGVLEAPMLFTSNDEFQAFSEGEAGQQLMDDLASEVDLHPLFVAPHEGPRYITTASTPIHEPSDMQGLSLRNPEVPSFTIMAEAVSASPVALDFSELYLALDRGVVDGQHNPLSHVVGQSFYEVQDYLSMVPWGISPHIVSMSTCAWDDLSEGQQSALEDAAAETASAYFELAEEETQERLDFLQDKIDIIPTEDVDVEAFETIFEEDGLPALRQEYGDQGGALLDAILAER